MTADRLDAIDAELCRRDPDRRPLSAAAKAMIVAALHDAPPLSPATRRHIARLLRPVGVGLTMPTDAEVDAALEVGQ